MYQISIRHTDGRFEARDITDRVELCMVMGDLGGEYRHDNSNPRQRAELLGHPVFSNANMIWQATQDKVRYEVDLRPREQVNEDGSPAFKVGHTYSTRYLTNDDVVCAITVARRTAKTLWTERGETLRIRMEDGVETVCPGGNRSTLSTVVRAAR